MAASRIVPGLMECVTKSGWRSELGLAKGPHSHPSKSDPMIRTLSIFAILFLGACGQQNTADPPANEAAAAPAVQAEVPSLEGSWQVTMVDGAEAKPIGMTATIGGGRA